MCIHVGGKLSKDSAVWTYMYSRLRSYKGNSSTTLRTEWMTYTIHISSDADQNVK